MNVETTVGKWVGPKDQPSPTFVALSRAQQEYDESLRQLERANPENFAVERRSRFAAALNVYLNEAFVEAIWKPWPTEHDVLVQQDRGVLNLTYRAHGDPSLSGANFGFAIAHVAGEDDRGLPHVVFDVIHHWQPGDFPENNNHIDYDYIGDRMVEYLDRFMPGEMTYDQWNSVSTVQRLQKHALKAGHPKRTVVYERTATKPLNWKTYETFKTALGLGLVHGPYYEQADLELKFLQDIGGKVEAPTTGPIQVKDTADCLSIVTYELIGNQLAAFIGKTLGDLPLVGAQPGGWGQGKSPQQDREVYESFSRLSQTRRTPRGITPSRTPSRRSRGSRRR